MTASWPCLLALRIAQATGSGPREPERVAVALRTAAARNAGTEQATAAAPKRVRIEAGIIEAGMIATVAEGDTAFAVAP